jgi:ethanolamine ammonia-lyase small subunit
MRNFKIIIAGLVFAASCGKGGLDGKLEELSKIKDEACACKDKACADAVNKKMDDAMNGMKEPSADDAKKLMDIMAEAGVCLAKAGATAGGK